MKRKTYDKARRLDAQIRDKQAEISRVKAALDDCRNCILMVGCATFDIDEWTGKNVLEAKLDGLEFELDELLTEFEKL